VRVALDANRYTDLARGVQDVLDVAERADQILIPVVVVAELRAGFAVGQKGRQNEAFLQRFLASPGVDVLYLSDATTRVYASLYRQLRAQGTPIPTNDLWISSLVIEHNLALCTRDGHFRHLPQLVIV
jgi:predicted nucleic acid-binding protein